MNLSNSRSAQVTHTSVDRLLQGKARFLICNRPNVDVCALQEGIQAVREKASFVERELREQLADVRGYLEEERQQRRSAETSLARQLQQAQADASALRARLAAAEETQGQREVCESAHSHLHNWRSVPRSQLC